MNWTVENDDECKRTIFEGGADIVGFDFEKPDCPVYNQMTNMFNPSTPVLTHLDSQRQYQRHYQSQVRLGLP